MYNCGCGSVLWQVCPKYFLLFSLSDIFSDLSKCGVRSADLSSAKFRNGRKLTSTLPNTIVHCRQAPAGISILVSISILADYKVLVIRY